MFTFTRDMLRNILVIRKEFSAFSGSFWHTFCWVWRSFEWLWSLSCSLSKCSGHSNDLQNQHKIYRNDPENTENSFLMIKMSLNVSLVKGNLKIKVIILLCYFERLGDYQWRTLVHMWNLEQEMVISLGLSSIHCFSPKRNVQQSSMLHLTNFFHPSLFHGWEI